MSNDEQDVKDDEFGLAVKITVSLDEAETIIAMLHEADDDHLASHVRYCVQEAKEKAGYLTPAKKAQV